MPWRSPNKYRLLLKVNPGGVSRSNSPVSVEIDFAQALCDKGITGKFDEHTIEIISCDASGLPKVFDASRDGYERYLLPWHLQKYYGTSKVILGFVMPDQTCTAYTVYFDTAESAPARPPRYPGLVGDGDFFRQNHRKREIGACHFDCFCDLDNDGDLDLFKGGVEPFIYCYENVGGIRFYERDYIEDCIRNTHPIARIEGLQKFEPSFLEVVRRYADTMIEYGRDTYGDQKSGLLLSALDRNTLGPLTIRPSPPGGIRREDRSGLPWRPLVGANPHLDQNLLRILYTLTEITGDRRYSDAADRELEWFFKNTQSPVTGLLPWGEHLCWDVMLDKPVSGGTDYNHEFARPWVLWDRCYQLAPEASKKFALGLWEHQVADHNTGAFDRHAPYDRHGPVDGKDFPRHGGFYIVTWAYAYKHTKDETFLHAIETILTRFERKRYDSGGIAHSTIGPLDVETAASLMPAGPASRLRKFAEMEDQLVLEELRKNYGSADGTFAFNPTWQAAYGAGVTADWAMFAWARYEQVKKNQFRDLVIAAADAYVDALPDEDVDVWPMSLAHIISAQVAAYKLTNRAVYLEQACRFARMAVDTFWQDKTLPRASFKTDHYETITGADSLALALLEVHAAINNMKTAIPSNTIDR